MPQNAPPDAGPGAGLLARWRAHPTRVVLLLAVAALVPQVWGFHDLRHDDAYITYRYGQNLASGHGLVFNPGQRIMGSTSPGQALLAGALYPLFGQRALPSVMSSIGCVGWLLQALALWVLLRPAVGAAAAAGVALAVAAGVALSWSCVALETNVVAALALFALCAVRAERWTAAAALCAVAGLFRADVHLLTALIALACVLRLRWAAWKPALVLVGLSLPWLIFAATYYGALLPRSARVKWHRTPIGEYAAHALSYPAQLLFDKPSVLLAVVTWVLAIAGSVLLIRRARSLWPLPAWAALHLGAYIAISPFKAHTWHLYPLGLVVSVLALYGATRLLTLAPRPGLRRAGGAAVALLIAVYALRSGHAATTHDENHWLGSRDRVYRDVAAYLRAHAAPTDGVAAVEVGTVGYYAQLPMHDLGGLVSERWRYIPPSVRWAIVDPHNPIVYGERKPVAAFRHGDFIAALYDLGRRTRTIVVLPGAAAR